MPRKFSTRIISDYFNPNQHRSTRNSVEDPAVNFVLRERERNNETFKQEQLFAKLEQDYQAWIKENDGKNTKEKNRP